MGRSAKIRHRRLRRQRHRRELAAKLLDRVRAAFMKAGKKTGWTKAEREILLRRCRSALRKQYGPTADVSLVGDTLICNIPRVVQRPAEYIHMTLKV
jgi:hypothetical protein